MLHGFIFKHTAESICLWWMSGSIKLFPSNGRVSPMIIWEIGSIFTQLQWIVLIPALATSAPIADKPKVRFLSKVYLRMGRLLSNYQKILTAWVWVLFLYSGRKGSFLWNGPTPPVKHKILRSFWMQISTSPYLMNFRQSGCQNGHKKAQDGQW